MAYVRKTVDRWDIESNWGCGWYVECSEYTRVEAKKTYKEYLENFKCPVRMIKRREKNENTRS